MMSVFQDINWLYQTQRVRMNVRREYERRQPQDDLIVLDQCAICRKFHLAGAPCWMENRSA